MNRTDQSPVPMRTELVSVMFGANIGYITHLQSGMEVPVRHRVEVVTVVWLSTRPAFSAP